MIDRKAAESKGPPTGILDLIAEGMSLILIAPWLVLFPLALDAWYLLGPGISTQSLTDWTGKWLGDRGSAPDLATWVSARGPWDLMRGPAFLITSVVDGISSSHVYQPISRTIAAPGALTVLIASVLIFIFTCAIFVAYEVAMASAAGFIRTAPRPAITLYLDRLGRFLLFVLVLTIAVSAIMAVVLIPVHATAKDGITASAAGTSLALIGLAVQIVVLFAPEAIVIDGLGPFAAVAASARVVFGSFWRSMGFLAVTLLIDPGLISIWKEITDQAMGLAIAIVVNAALITSVAAASLGYYWANSGDKPSAVPGIGG